MKKHICSGPVEIEEIMENEYREESTRFNKNVEETTIKISILKLNL